MGFKVKDRHEAIGFVQCQWRALIEAFAWWVRYGIAISFFPFLYSGKSAEIEAGCMHTKQLRNINFLNVSPSRMSRNPRNICSRCKSHSSLSRFPWFQDCDVDFVLLFHNVTCYINLGLSRIHVNTTNSVISGARWLPQAWYYRI